MRFITSTVAVLASLALAEEKRAACPDYALVDARGTGEPQRPSAGFEGIGTPGMANQTLAILPNGIQYDVHYPADASPTSEKMGGDDAIRYLTEQRAACPNQKFALLGYSQGATVVLMALRHFADDNDFIKAVIFLGNPYQVKNQISTVDENGGDKTRGSTGVLLGLEPSLGLSDSLAHSGKVLNICHVGDFVCNGIALDTLNPEHLSYPFTESVQTMGRNLLVEKLR